MGVEAIGSAISSVASSVGRAGASLGGSLGKGLEGIGRPMGLADIGPVFNEGPVNNLNLGEFMPIAKVF